MTFQCAHTGFARAVTHPVHDNIGRGNVMSNTQSSTYVRSYDQTHCNGFDFEPGRLREFDLGFFGRDVPSSVLTMARSLTKTADVIVYRFFHWQRRVRITHGWLITNRDHETLWRLVTGPTWKSAAALDAAEAVITTSART